MALGHVAVVVAVVAGRHRKDVLEGVAGRIRRSPARRLTLRVLVELDVVVHARVAGGDHDQDAGLASSRDRGTLRLRPHRVTEAQVDHVGVVVDRVVDRLQLVPEREGRRRADPQCHDRAVRTHPADPLVVVVLRRDDARNVRAVRVVERIGWRRVLVVPLEVPAVHVVGEPVPVVIHAIARDLSRVHPQPIREVRLVDVDAGVDHGDDRGSMHGLRVPCPRRLDIGSGGAVPGSPETEALVGHLMELARVVDRPLLLEEGVVGDGRDAGDPVGLGEADQRRPLIAADRGWDGRSTADLHDVDVQPRLRGDRPRAEARVQRPRCRTGRVLLPDHDDMTGNEAGDTRSPRVLGVAGGTYMLRGRSAGDGRGIGGCGRADEGGSNQGSERNRESEPGEHSDSFRS